MLIKQNDASLDAVHSTLLHISAAQEANAHQLAQIAAQLHADNQGAEMEAFAAQLTKLAHSGHAMSQMSRNGANAVIQSKDALNAADHGGAAAFGA